MRVTLVISSLAAGGAERVITTMANFWAEREWSITLLTFDDGQLSPFYPLHPDVSWRPLALEARSAGPLAGALANIRRLCRLRQAIRQTAPDVVISFMDRTNVLTIMATRGLGVPVVISERAVPRCQPIGRAWNLLRSWTYPLADRLVVQTESVLEFFSPAVRARGRVIPNPVVPIPTPAMPRSHGHRIAAVGRLGEEKGFDLLLKAFSVVAARHPDWSLVIWGEGPLRRELTAIRDSLGLSERISLPGRTEDVWAALASVDLFVLPSRYEGFPNALCEAMASGLPVIATDCPEGPRAIVIDGVDGLLVPPEDVDALAAALDRLLSAPDERARLAAAAPTITERLGLLRIMSSWEVVLEEARA